MRTRSLLASEAGKCFRTYIDDFFLDNLIVLNLYDNGLASSPGYDLYSYSYGSLASTIKVIPATAPSYLQFTPSTYTSSVISSSSFSWIYINTGSSATVTNITVNQHNDALSTHLATGTLSISYTGLCVILATSQNCLVISKGTTYLLYVLTQSSLGAITFTPTDITAAVSNAPTKVSWKVSTDCSKISVDNYIFASFSGSFSLVNNNFNKFTWIAIDKTFTYALLSGSIWKYDATSNLNKSYSTLNSTFTSGSQLLSYSTRIIVYQLTSLSALVNSFIDTGSALTQLPSIQMSGFKATPKIALSPQLSLVVIYGASTNAALTNIYYIDYSDKTFDVLDFPEDAVFDPSSLYICLEETWMYVRQLASSLQTPG